MQVQTKSSSQCKYEETGAQDFTLLQKETGSHIKSSYVQIL